MIQIWGHRGCKGAGNPPENSIEAFQAAIKQGADGVELDVFLTKDNHLVVFHDDTLERMTNYDGPDKRKRHITDFTLAELKALRLKHHSGQVDDNISIPTLDEVLEAARNHRVVFPDFLVNIEIKHDKQGRNIAAEVAKVVEKRWNEGWGDEDLIVSSFDKQSLLDIKKENPAIPRGALVASGHAPWDISEEKLAEELAEIKKLGIEPKTVNITLPSMTKKTVDMIRTMGCAPVAWTSGEQSPSTMSVTQRRELAAKLEELGIEALITDYPDQIIRTLDVYHRGEASRDK